MLDYQVPNIWTGMRGFCIVLAVLSVLSPSVHAGLQAYMQSATDCFDIRQVRTGEGRPDGAQLLCALEKVRISPIRSPTRVCPWLHVCLSPRCSGRPRAVAVAGCARARAPSKGTVASEGVGKFVLKLRTRAHEDSRCKKRRFLQRDSV